VCVGLGGFFSVFRVFSGFSLFWVCFNRGGNSRHFSLIRGVLGVGLVFRGFPVFSGFFPFFRVF